MSQIIELVRDFEGALGRLIQQYGAGVYALMAAILFAETGLVFMPFLPGDTMLFAAGMAAAGVIDGPNGTPALLDIRILLPLLTLAPLLGDQVNYFVGKKIGRRLFEKDKGLFKKTNLEKTEKFFAKYGGKAVIFARWVPIVRTIAPFVAGMGAMEYSRFLKYSVTGAFIWVWVCTLAGYFLGSIPWVKNNFEIAMLSLIVISIIPIIIEYRKEKKHIADVSNRVDVEHAHDAPPA